MLREHPAPLRIFRCDPYNALLTPASCSARRASQLRETSPTRPGRLGRPAAGACVDCAVGKAHASGRDAEGVEYLTRDPSAPLPASAISRPPPPLIPTHLRALVEREESPPVPEVIPETKPRATKKRAPKFRTRVCIAEGCSETFEPTGPSARYCPTHRPARGATAKPAPKRRGSTSAQLARDIVAATATPKRERPPEVDQLRARVADLERELDEARSEPRVDPAELLRACGFRVSRYGGTARDVILRVEGGGADG